MDNESNPFWLQDQSLKNYQTLKENHNCDVCIVGAGISGLMTAYLLCKEGENVIVLDDGPVAGGQTMRTTAHLTNVLDDRYYELERLFGKKGASLAAESHRAAIDLVASLVKKHTIDCDFNVVDSYLFVPPEESFEQLEQELQASQRAGLSVKKVDRCPFRSFDTKQALCFSNQAEFHPLKFINKLCELIEARGGRIFCGTHVTEIKGRYHVETNQNVSLNASHVVVATNSPINSRFFPHLKQAAYRTYVIAGKVPKGYVPAGLYYDTPDPYHYIRVVKGQDYDILIVGGEDHRTGEETHLEQHYNNLEAWTKERFPEFTEITHRWSGQILEPVDCLGLIGRVADEMYIITGDSGNGLTHGIIGGILISDLIHGRKSPWEKLYDPHRINIKAAKEFIEENSNTAWQYTDWLTPGENAELELNCGHIIREGIHKCAVYRDAQGKTHKMSAVCPHLGAIVHWNNVENCWECPAHGSRFTAMGAVIQGPANCNLKPE